MSPAIHIRGRSKNALPSLGLGLWVDGLHTVDAVERLITQLAPAHMDLLVDLRQDGSLSRLRAALAVCERTGTDVWLQTIVSDEHPHPELQSLAQTLREMPCRPRGILVTPAAYLESYQPTGQWPRGLTPDQAAKLAHDYLPECLTGGGVPTYFTELNRCRPDPECFDYLTHATSPVVHAADDRSVMESLESLPHIFRSGRQLAHGKPYRLTTSAIGAWRNPYGGQLTPNPRRDRLTLSDRDPRQRSLLAGAWTLAHYAASHRAGLDASALWAVNEPFAVAGEGEYFPVFHLLKGLCEGQGKPALDIVSSSPHVEALGWLENPDQKTARIWLANLTAEPQDYSIQGISNGTVRLLDADSYPHAIDNPLFWNAHPGLNHTQAKTHTLLPFAVIMIDCHVEAEPAL